MRLICALAWLGLLLGVSPARAAEALPVAENPELEARVLRISEELRCLVCQNQTIADSNAELAKDLRREVREMLSQGQTEAQVREFMVTRYGDFILYRPPYKLTTLLLWLGPFILLVVAVLIHWRTVMRRRAATGTDDLSSAQHERMQELLDAGPMSRRK